MQNIIPPLPKCKDHNKPIEYFDFTPKMTYDQQKMFCQNCKNRPNANLITIGSLIQQVGRLKDDEIKRQKEQVKKNRDDFIDFQERMEKIYKNFNKQLESFEKYQFQADQLYKQISNLIGIKDIEDNKQVKKGIQDINVQNLYDIVSPKITIQQDSIQIINYLVPQFEDYSDLFTSMTEIYQSHIKARDPAGKTINQTYNSRIISTNQNSNRTYLNQSVVNQSINNQQQINQQFQALNGRMTTSNTLVQSQRNQQLIQQSQQIVNIKMGTNVPIVQQQYQPPINQSQQVFNDQPLIRKQAQSQQYQGNFHCVKHGRKFEKVSLGDQVALYCLNCVPQEETISFNDFNDFILSLKERKNSSPSDIIINNFIEWYNSQEQIISQQIQQMQQRINNSLNDFQINFFQEQIYPQFINFLEQEQEACILELFQDIQSYFLFDNDKIYHKSQTLIGLREFKTKCDVLKQSLQQLEKLIASIESN